MEQLSGHLGHQTLVELYGCPEDIIDDKNKVESILVELANLIDLTIVNTTIHHFSPIGVSGVVVVQESHITVHTWPEHNYVAIDFFTCNVRYDINKGVAFLKEKLKAKKVEINEIQRGPLDKIKTFNK
ncbi:MAG: adenosylmethionine decarboxylase [Saprospiraceae bacterium]